MKNYNKTKFAFLILLLPFLTFGAETSGRKQAVKAAAKWPILHEGRTKPLDTFAQVNLLAIYGKRSVGKTGASEWLLETMFSPETANNMQVFDIRNDKVADALSMEARKTHKYSFNEVWPKIRDNMELLRSAFNKSKDERDLVESQLLELYGNVSRYMDISQAASFFHPTLALSSEELAAAFGIKAKEKQSFYFFNKKMDVFAKFLSEMQQKPETDLNSDDLEIVRLAQTLSQVRESMNNTNGLQVIPPLAGSQDQIWYSPWSLLSGKPVSERDQDILKTWEDLYQAFMNGQNLNQEGYDRVYAALVSENSGMSQDKLQLEVWNNSANLFYKSVAFYILGFLLIIISWTAWEAPLKKISFVSLLIGLGFHAAGIILRMIIMGRPPVSTLYESIIFVGFISVFSCMVYELMRKNSLGIFSGATLGTLLHFIGFSYAADGDTMGMLVAVLDSNFWLATHVVTISIGYGCAFVAGFVGHLYLFFKIFKPHMKTRLQNLSRTMISTSLVALFFTLFGTILGGIWADQSWGRFWGWDPKENGALLIVLWFLVLLHGRISGVLKDNGFAFGLVINNTIVALAWFGVNLLNVGLHSYGFTESIAFNLLLFCGGEALIGLAGYLWARTKTT